MKRIKNYFICLKYPFLRPIYGKTMDRYQNYLKWKEKAERALDGGNIRKYMWSMVVYYIKAYFFVLFSFPIFTFYEDIPTGWRKAFGKKMLKELRKQCVKEGELFEWRIMNVKEKYGQLRIDCNYASKEIYDILFKYEALSWNYCIECGKTATTVSTGWIRPYCDKCAPEHAVTMKEYMDDISVG